MVDVPVGPDMAETGELVVGGGFIKVAVADFLPSPEPSVLGAWGGAVAPEMTLAAGEGLEWAAEGLLVLRKLWQ